MEIQMHVNGKSSSEDNWITYRKFSPEDKYM